MRACTHALLLYSGSPFDEAPALTILSFSRTTISRWHQKLFKHCCTGYKTKQDRQPFTSSPHTRCLPVSSEQSEVLTSIRPSPGLGTALWSSERRQKLSFPSSTDWIYQMKTTRWPTTTFRFWQTTSQSGGFMSKMNWAAVSHLLSAKQETKEIINILSVASSVSDQCSFRHRGMLGSCSTGWWPTTSRPTGCLSHLSRVIQRWTKTTSSSPEHHVSGGLAPLRPIFLFFRS